MFTLPPKADICDPDWYVRFVPKADIRRCRAQVRLPSASSQK